jgi:hypothetical protein
LSVKAGEEEVLHHRTRLHRRHAMAALHPLFRRQAFQVEPHRTRLALRHRIDVAGRNIDRKELDHDIGHLLRL